MLTVIKNRVHTYFFTGIMMALALTSSLALAKEYVVDGSSVEAYERSIKAMADSLNEQDKKDFGRGLLNMILTEYSAAHGATGLSLLQFMGPAIKAAHISMDGHTLEEILERGRSISDDSATAAVDKDAVEDSAEALRRCLQDKVIVELAAIKKGDFFGYYVEVTVTNRLDWAIAGIRIAYQVFSEGRSVPWMDEDFSLAIRGGIEPGETRKLGTTTSFVPADAPEELITHAQVLDVTDQFKRQLIRDVRVIGWGKDKSEMKCKSADGK